MRSLEIELRQGLLLIGPPTAFHHMLTREVGDLATPQTLKTLSRDTLALARLRAGWRRICPAQSAAALGDQQLVGALIRQVGTGRLKAMVLRDRRGRMRPLPPPLSQMQLIHAPLGDRTVLIAAKGRLPGPFAKSIDNKAAAQMLGRLENTSEPAHLIDRQARRLPGNANGSKLGAPLRYEIMRRLQFGGCDAAVLTEPFAIAQAAAREDAPTAILNWSREDRIYDALARATRHLPRELANASGLIIDLGMLISTLVTERGAAAGRFSDPAILVSIVYRLAGDDGLDAIEQIIDAIHGAGSASREPELDAAARQLAKAFTAFGLDNGQAKLSELRRRLMAREWSRLKDSAAPLKRPAANASAQASAPPGLKPAAQAPARTPDQTPDQTAPQTPVQAQPPAQPNAKVVEKDGNKATWSLDQNGRPVKVSAKLAKLAHDDRGREELSAQAVVGARGRATDDAGHMIGHRFMGDQGIVNLFPQNSNLNRGAFKKVENEWADWIEHGCSVETTIELLDIVDDRPNEIAVSYKVFDKAGKQIFAKDALFANQKGQTFVRRYNKDMDKIMKGQPPSPPPASGKPPTTRKRATLKKLTGPKT